MLSLLSFSEYSAWCKSRVPAFDCGPGPASSANTVLAMDEEPCPATVRSYEDRIVVTPRGVR